MLQIMANENMEEWGSSAWVEMETVDAVVQAYAAGQIELERPHPTAGSVRFAGSASTDADRRPFTAQTVARFLGWTFGEGIAQDKVKVALAALELIRDGVLTESQFVDLRTKQAEALVQQTRRALRDEDAKRLREEADREAKAATRAAKEREQADAERQKQERAEARAKDEAARAEASRKRIEAEREAEAARQRDTAARPSPRLAGRSTRSSSAGRRLWPLGQHSPRRVPRAGGAHNGAPAS